VFKWAQSIVVGDDPELVARYGTAEEGRRQSYEYMERLLEQRRREPQDDLATHVASAELKPDDLSDSERVGILRLVMEAGADTTIASIALGLEAFSQHRDQWEALQKDRALIPRAVEEILRWTSVAAHMRRTATKDVEVRGKSIARGDAVVTWLIAANRDPELVENPEVFDITRKSCPHQAFGAGGPHHCPGASLARMEMRIVFEELLDRMPDITLDGPVDRMRSNMILGVKRMPVRFTPSTPRP
jgi:cholest-4-en-3-one 26-monooxygenase